MWKKADGEELPEYEREVIVLYQDYTDSDIYRVGFGHRPNPKGYDAKSITTGIISHYTPMTYDKGGWNSPNIMWWLDLDLPSSKDFKKDKKKGGKK